MGKILFKSILSTSTQSKKYLKYKSKYIISKVFKIRVQNTAPQNVFKIQVPKYLLGERLIELHRLDIYGNIVTIKFCLIVNFSLLGNYIKRHIFRV